MAQFLKPTDLIKELKILFSEAESELTLVSPYIKLHDEIKNILTKKINDPEFHLFVVFGKNEDDLSKSLSNNDFDFFKQFQNVEIRYVENLHAKYYANDSKSIITSLNLHSFSIKNNIEVGVLFEQKMGARVLNFISESLAKDSNADNEAYEYFSEVIEKSVMHFEKRAKMKSSWFGFVKTQEGNIVEVDNSSKIYSSKNTGPKTKETKTQSGFCIRTGVQIPFNINVPFSKPAYESWSKWKNKDFKEKYCHYSGEASNGETSFAKPVLGKYYREAASLQKALFS
jgi:hypothetical protein